MMVSSDCDKTHICFFYYFLYLTNFLFFSFSIETRDTIFGLLKELRARFADAFNRVVASDTEAANFAQTCSW